MDNIRHSVDGTRLIVFPEGHIDSANAQDFEETINELRSRGSYDEIELNCGQLQYISSAGLRVILRLRKDVKAVVLSDVSPEIYEILDVTGFTELVEVQKAYRRVSIEGCEVIGQGANGKVYRIDPETIVKVYYNVESLPEIRRERELARKAFVLGIPTAISYDVVRVGDSYGAVYELLNAKSFLKLLTEQTMSLEEVIRMSIDLLKMIHATQTDDPIMPSMKTVALGWADFLGDYLPEEQYKKLRGLIEEVPESDHMLHGDYHLKNIMYQDGESLLIDMDTLCVGNPVFELASMYNAYVGYGETDERVTTEFLGVSRATAREIWDRSLRLYLDDMDEEKILEIEKKAMLIGYTRIMRRTIRRNGLNTTDGQELIACCRKHIEELLAEVDTLLF